MAKLSLKAGLGLVLCALSNQVFATPGAVDEYDCHRDYVTDKYHCHGDANQAKQSHALFGISSKSDVWQYSDGPLNLFTGGAGEIEYGLNHIAVHAGYGYQVHISGDTDYTLAGWDVGLKGGPNIARIGLHPYAEVGYFSQSFQIPNNPAINFNGWQYGGGLIWNRSAFAVDLRVLNKTTANLEQVWISLNGPGLTSHISTQLGFYLRF